MPFFMLGYPTIEDSFTFIKAAIDAGVDALELGIPFSDPIADGPVIENAACTALKNGADFQACLGLLEGIRQYSDVPIGLLVYYNLLFQQGEAVYQTLQQAGVDAVLAVDLPLEESCQHERLLAEYNLGAVQLIMPNSDEKRSQQLLKHSTAFAYLVSRYGTTGAQVSLSSDLAQRIQHLQSMSDTPLVVGFGISNVEQVKSIFASGAQGAIIGSQITKWIAEKTVKDAKQHITTLINEVKSC